MRWVPGSQRACRPYRISEICRLYDATRPCRLACGSIYAPSTIQVGKLDGGSSKIMHARGCSRLGSRRVTSRAGMQQGNDNGRWPGTTIGRYISENLVSIRHRRLRYHPGEIAKSSKSDFGRPRPKRSFFLATRPKRSLISAVFSTPVRGVK